MRANTHLADTKGLRRSSMATIALTLSRRLVNTMQREGSVAFVAPAMAWSWELD